MHLEPISEECQVPNASKLDSLKKENDDLKELINKQYGVDNNKTGGMAKIIENAATIAKE
jgi:hypothetical protein